MPGSASPGAAKFKVRSLPKKRFTVGASDRVKTVSKLPALELLGLALSEKQIPQIVENSKKCGELLEPLERDGMRPRHAPLRAGMRSAPIHIALRIDHRSRPPIPPYRRLWGRGFSPAAALSGGIASPLVVPAGHEALPSGAPEYGANF